MTPGIIGWLFSRLAGNQGELRFRPMRDRSGELMGVVDPGLPQTKSKPPVDLGRYKLERRPVDLDNRINKAR